MDIQVIVKELKRERDRLNRAIAALEEAEPSPAPQTPPTAAKLPSPRAGKVDHLTPEGRKRLSDGMKKRWAEKRKKTSRGNK